LVEFNAILLPLDRFGVKHCLLSSSQS